MSVYILPLGDAGEPRPLGDGQFVNLPIPASPYTLRLVVFSASPVSHRAVLWTNVPAKDKTANLDTYQKFDIDARFNRDAFVDIDIAVSGSFHYYISYYDAALDRLVNTTKYYFIVSSGFSLNGRNLSLDSLAIQTVVSKWMGPYETWEPKLAAIRNKGYNMVHFTPLQPRGDSNSPYSIFDQLSWDQICFPNGHSDVEELVAKMQSQHNLLAMTDVVYNHTANNSLWLQDHPEAGYSVDTAPHLACALELEDALVAFSGRLQDYGVKAELKTESDLNALMAAVKTHVVDALDLWEYHVVNVEAVVKAVSAIVADGKQFDAIDPQALTATDLKSLAKAVRESAAVDFDKFGHARFAKTIEAPALVAIIKAVTTDKSQVLTWARHIVDEVNADLYQEFNEDVAAIVSNLNGRTRFTRLSSDGPQLGPISAASPLPELYFTKVKTKTGVVSLVNNGFLWNGNPLVDFASDRSRAYFRREVISWGDCVKLRYGSGPQDSPFLWDHMTKYTQLLAKYFHGFRIDNCHSTPVHVGEYMLAKARQVRNNLYVAAELFSGSEANDKIFVERFGITSLIREAMQAWSPAELSRLVHKHGGRPIGSFSQEPLKPLKTGAECTEGSIVHVKASAIHALFMDCTHDNEMPAQKRTVEDTLPNAALVAMCACAIGSTMGYDECYPEYLNVVSEERQYTFGGGISRVKRMLQDLHVAMGQHTSSETYIHHEDQYITVHRVIPKTSKGYFLIARTKFDNKGADQFLNDVVLTGTRAKFLFAASLQANEKNGKEADQGKIHGIATQLVELEPPTITEEGSNTRVRIPANFPQGSIAVLETWIPEVDSDLDTYVRSEAANAVHDLSLLDLNVLLYRCESEERDASVGKDGVYTVPGFGPLVYAGLQGWASILEQVVQQNNLAHPLCENLRNGQWALDYTVGRLAKYQSQYPNLDPVIAWLSSRFERIRKVPSFLLPRYFGLVIFSLYAASRSRALSLMPDIISQGTTFAQDLALVSLQMNGRVPSTSVFPRDNVACMAAGLPHFSFNYMRCWGRDVFISLRGLLLIPQRVGDAANHILGFAATLKHGLIPNLLDAGRNPRYNARDATWFFLQTVQDYTEMVPGGLGILDAEVKRRFPLDDTWVDVDDERAFAHTSTVREIVYEILSRHARGIAFREANAGPALDSQMLDEGFNQKIEVDWALGLVFGGNQYNCGTWMDKMGESVRAGNKGVPGTPRDGAAIEISGLLKSALRWVNKLRMLGQFNHDSVVNQHGDTITLEDWESKIQTSFERCYYVPDRADQDKDYDVDPNIVHRRGIYKDLYRSGKPYEDYQLRPNFAIAMCVAPELFDVQHALTALAVADNILLGPVGMATLDPEDLNYRPYYRNGLDNDDFATSKGRNYHQGPEWVWLRGYYLRAMLLFESQHRRQQGQDLHPVLQKVAHRLRGDEKWLRESSWRGLTELTNKNGELCDDSSPSQAWSAATLLDLYYDAAVVA